MKGYGVTVLLASFIQNILIFNEYLNKSSLTFLSLYFETSSNRGLRDQIIMFEDRTLQCITNPLWVGVKGNCKGSFHASTYFFFTYLQSNYNAKAIKVPNRKIAMSGWGVQQKTLQNKRKQCQNKFNQHCLQ